MAVVLHHGIDPGHRPGPFALVALRNRPSDATWLKAEKQAWLAETLEDEKAFGSQKHGSFWKNTTSGKVWVLEIVYCGSCGTNNACRSG